MSIATTILHVQTTAPEAVERALEQVFAAQSHPRATRLEGTFSAVLAKATDNDLAANYRYLICRPHPDSAWTPILELGVRTVGLEARLSRALGGAAVFTTFVYGDGVSGYRLARDGAEVDRYASDPTYLLDLATIPRNAAEGRVSLAQPNPERERGRPALFADLLPTGTTPDEFARVVLAPGWWEQYDAAAPLRAQAAAEAAAHADDDDDDFDDDDFDDDDFDDNDSGEGDDDDFSDDDHMDATGESNDAEATGDDDDGDDDDEEEVIDEGDRMRCIALALELWGPDEYPFAQELEEITNKQVGPATLLGFV